MFDGPHTQVQQVRNFLVALSFNAAQEKYLPAFFREIVDDRGDLFLKQCKVEGFSRIVEFGLSGRWKSCIQAISDVPMFYCIKKKIPADAEKIRKETEMGLERISMFPHGNKCLLDDVVRQICFSGLIQHPTE